MAGLARICKLMGGMTVTDRDGHTVRYVWDYANDRAVRAEEMPVGSELWKNSERAKYAETAKRLRR